VIAISVLIGVLIVVVVGAICFVLIDRLFATADWHACSSCLWCLSVWVLLCNACWR
jgi:hypothetical protein